MSEENFKDKFTEISDDGKNAEQFGEVFKELPNDLPAGYKNLIAKPGFRKELVKILADGEWHTTTQVMAAFQKTFPTADLSVARRAISSLLRDPPCGKEVVAEKFRKKYRYRMRDAAVAERKVPTELVTTLVEGVNPIIKELNHWAQQNQYEIPPSAMGILAARLEKLLEPLKKSVSS